MKKHLLKLSTFASLPLLSLAAISCSNEQNIPPVDNNQNIPPADNNQNIPPVDYEMIDVETNGLAFNSKGEITKFYNFGGSADINLVIPEYLVNNRILTSEYYGYTQRITRIGNDAFSTNSNQWAQYLKNVTLPDSIESIGAKAFYRTPLTEIIIPDSVVNIGDGAFENCKNLTNVKLSKNTEYIGSFSFAGIGITTISFPNSLLEIDFGAFAYSKLSGSLYIPDSVVTIGSCAFDGTQLKEVSIPKDCVYDSDSFPPGCKVTRRP